MSPLSNGHHQLHGHQQDHYVKKEEANNPFASSCLYSVDSQLVHGGVKQEDAALALHGGLSMYGSSQVKLEPEQLHAAYHHHNAALYDPQRTCWSSLTDRAAVAAAAVSGIYASPSHHHHLGRPVADPYADFAAGRASELDHYSALQKLTCTFPPSLAPSSSAMDCPPRSSASQCLQIGVDQQQQLSQQQNVPGQQSAAAYRMNAASAPLYAMSSLSYSEWTASNPASNHRGNNGAASLTSAPPVTKGQH